MNAGADIVFIQTFIDLDLIKIATEVAKKFGKPVFCCLSFEKVGKTIMGNSVDDFIEEMTALKIDAIGMNCSLGPDLAVPIIKSFCGKTDLPLIFKPNAGKPILSSDGSTSTTYSADVFVKDVLPALEFVDYIGGCCGAEPEYIKLLAETIKTL